MPLRDDDVKCHQNNQRSAGVATTVIAILSNMRKYCKLYFKQYSNSHNLPLTSHNASPTQCLSFYHTLTHTQDQSQSLLLTLLISGFLANKTTTSRRSLPDVHTRARTRLHPAAPAAASLHRKQASGCYRPSPCLLSKV